MYAELLCKTHYSFLEGSSHPAELVGRAAELGLAALAVTDRNGVYGMPKAYLATKEFPLHLIVGAELTLADSARRAPLPPLTLLARDRKAYGLLCRMVTSAHCGAGLASAPTRKEGGASLEWADFLKLMEHPASRGLIAIARRTLNDIPDYDVLRELFGTERLLIPATRFLDGFDRMRVETAVQASRRYGARLIATNDVHYHAPERRMLQDTLSAIRLGTPLALAGRRLHSNAESYLKSPTEMAMLFRDLPEALANTLDVATSCVFSPAELRYRYPSEWIPQGETAQSYLEKLVWKGTEKRYPIGTPSGVKKQLEHELDLIRQLQFADYFLTIWEIVEFAREKDIICQGRGSAANSAVCFCLGITAIDPVRMNLLFERFISVERGEPPDIDVDFEHERREEVIQHIYQKYGRDRAAMVAAVVTYQDRLAIREVAKVLEVPHDDPLAQQLAEEVHGFPRHLSIHSGGFTLSADPIVETVPVEPASMEARTIVQWDKDDLDALGLLKVDVLALGMLTALHRTLDMLDGRYTLATIPPEDPRTYEMICRADTVGTFQIESRAQMGMLPRLLPKTFYDLVVQVAIVRPGPIVGKMVHPYLKRRKGLEPIDIPHPDLVPILGKTLGVPLFQEQVMKMAITLAKFSPGEADALRRAIGSWGKNGRASGTIDRLGQKLMVGLKACGLSDEYVTRIFEMIRGFSEYGFPESHAASFALIAYASAFLKCHHPAEFTCALLNSQPMGFYSSHTLVDDVKRHGVKVHPLDPNRSAWDCVVEGGEIRLGWRVVRGISEAEAQAIVRECPFKDLLDFLSRVRVRSHVLHLLALGDAFAAFHQEQRQALWEILAYQASVRPSEEGDQLSFFSSFRAADSAVFEKLDLYSEIRADYRAYGLSTRGHPMVALRPRFPSIPKWTSRAAKQSPNGRHIRIGGLVIVRQRPPTAAGVTFATLEDEDGFFDLILHKEVYEKYRDLFNATGLLIAEGKVQRDGNSVSLLVQKLDPVMALTELGATQAIAHARNFR